MKKIFLVIIACISFHANAGTYLAKQRVTEVANGWAETNLYITTDLPLSAEGCSETDFRYVLKQSHAQYDLVASMLLSAMHSRAQVRFYVSGCAGNLMLLKSVKVVMD